MKILGVPLIKPTSKSFVLALSLAVSLIIYIVLNVIGSPTPANLVISFCGAFAGSILYSCCIKVTDHGIRGLILLILFAGIIGAIAQGIIVLFSW